MAEVMVENKTNQTMRLPVADADTSTYGGYVQLTAFGSGSTSRALIATPAWNRMRLQYPQVQDWVTRQKLGVM